MNLQKYRDTAAAQTQAANPAQPTSEADRVEAARNALLYQMEDILGLKSYHHRRQSPNAPAPISHFASAIPTTEAHGNPQKPTLADPTSDSSGSPNQKSEIKIQNSTTASPNQNSKIANQNSTPEPPAAPPTEAHGNPQKPTLADPTSDSSHRSDSSDSSEPSDSRNQNSKTQNQKSEFCLECHHPLPPLLPNGRRPSNRCPKCNFPLPVPGSCYEPSIERCLDCRINLPRVGPDGKRPDIRCHKCGVHLPIKIPVPKP